MVKLTNGYVQVKHIDTGNSKQKTAMIENQKKKDQIILV